MLMNGMIKAKFIGKDHSFGFEYGKVYEMTRPKCDRPERFLCYKEEWSGELYAIPSDLFEIVEEV